MSVSIYPATLHRRNTPSTYTDDLIEERPLALLINQVSFAVFMRTPGDDIDLTYGFLWTERVIEEVDDLAQLTPCLTAPEQRLHATLASGVSLPERGRRGPLSSSCGLCSLEDIQDLQVEISPLTPRHLSPLEVTDYLQRFEAQLSLFHRTGGCHGAALFAPDHTLAFVREDVGRHNAVDKVLGAALRADHLSLTGWVMVVSSRAGYEIVQKAAVAGVSAVITLGAASGLAHRFALKVGLPLWSFARPQRAHQHLPNPSK